LTSTGRIRFSKKASWSAVMTAVVLALGFASALGAGCGWGWPRRIGGATAPVAKIMPPQRTRRETCFMTATSYDGNFE
jgi:hypothetical protein